MNVFMLILAVICVVAAMRLKEDKK